MSKTKISASSIDVFREKPTLRINEEELPAIKTWKIDGEYVLEVKVKMRSISKDDYSTPPNKIWASFRVLDVSVDDDQGDDLAKGMDSVKPQYIREKK